MTVDLDSGAGIFDRLGKIGYVMQITSDWFQGSGSGKLEQEIADVFGVYTTAANAVRGSLDSLLESKTAFQGDADAMLMALRDAAETTVIQMVHADDPLPSMDVETALKRLALQMSGASETLDANEPSASVTAATNDGIAKVIISFVGPTGKTRECVYDEDIVFECTSSSSAVLASLTIKGEASAASNGMSVFWPDGSTCDLTTTLINPELDGVLDNGGFETWSASTTPGTWTVVSGTWTQESTTKHLGSYGAKVTGDGATLHQIKQDVTASVFSQTVYAWSLALRVSSVPAAGVITVDLHDGTSVINDDAGNAQSQTISLTSGVSTSAWTTFGGAFRLPSPKPSSVFYRIRFSTALSNTVVCYLDSAMFGKAMTELYEGGPYAAVVATSSQLGIGDRWTVDVTNDYRGALQTLVWRLFGLPACQLPSATGGSETVSDALLG